MVSLGPKIYLNQAITSKREGGEMVQIEIWTEELIQVLEAWGSAVAQGQLGPAGFWGTSGAGMLSWGARKPWVCTIISSLAPTPFNARALSALKRAAESNKWALNFSQDFFSSLTIKYHPSWLLRGMDRRNWKGQEILMPVSCYLQMTGQTILKHLEVNRQPLDPLWLFPICKL